MENYLIANCTDTGRVRTINEDSMATFDSPNGRVVVVCDGMGGQNAGDVASQLAVAVIQDILTDNEFTTPEEAITKSIMAANQAILHRSSQNEGLSGMGATCVMLLISDGKVYYGSVGDSRIYYVAGGQIRQITKDQSYVQTLVDAGEISPEAAEHHRDKNQITNALGIQGMTPPVISQLPITPEPGSVFILCSDGLSGMVNNNVIQKIASDHSRPLSERAKELVNLANNAGGIDNITVQLVEFPKGSVAAGTPAGNPKKRTKSHTKIYVFVAVAVVLLLLICAGTYWMIERSKPKPVIKPAVKTETTVKEKKTPKNTEPAITSQPTTEPKVIVIEQEKPKRTTNKEHKKEKNSLGKEVTEKDPEPKQPLEKPQEMIINDLSGEKN